uniref:Protein kinase domain-containing protein n=1 Tax=Vitis vinifera TaxID=29760 RepID=A5C136_VITVI|nr:hypothetical protein VITISV_014897 [Vitis vinifera]
MGHCCSKDISVVKDDTVAGESAAGIGGKPTAPLRLVGNGAVDVKRTPAHSFNSPCPSPYPQGSSPLPPGIAPSPARTPRSRVRWPFPPPSPAKPIMSSILKRRGSAKPKEGPIPEEGAGEGETQLDKSFGYAKNFSSKFELGKEVGRGHFGHTCWARGKKGELKGQTVAVKIISKAKVCLNLGFVRSLVFMAFSPMDEKSGCFMTTAIAIEDVRREVKILKALSVHKNLVKFHDACEDASNVYIIMEGGRYREEDAKAIVVQILNVVAFCHLQGVVHRDLKPENFLFTTRDEDAPMKVIDFGLSDFIRTDQRLNDIVGSAYYVAPEVLHRSYNLEADVWSIGVITYILLCGSRPFWARTESGIFRSVLRADPNFDDLPWPAVSPEAKDFVKRLLNKDYRKRMTAAQALTHPWLRDENHAVPLDILVYKLVKSYVRVSPFKRAALKALSKALTEDELVYLRAQFRLLEPKNGRVSLENFKMALMRNATDAMKESRVADILNMMESLSFKKMDFEEFCAAAISPLQLEALQGWEKIATTGFEFFEQEGNRVTTVEELAREMNVGPAAYSAFNGWIRSSDGKLSFLGFTKFLHGSVSRPITRQQQHV